MPAGRSVWCAGFAVSGSRVLPLSLKVVDRSPLPRPQCVTLDAPGAHPSYLLPRAMRALLREGPRIPRSAKRHAAMVVALVEAASEALHLPLAMSSDSWSPLPTQQEYVKAERAVLHARRPGMAR